MTTITIEKELLDRALESMCWAARILNIDPDEAPNYHWSLENIRAALAAPATVQLRQGECWPESTMAQWDYYRNLIAEGDTSSGPRDWFESLAEMRLIAAPAPAPAWQDAPTCAGLWMRIGRISGDVALIRHLESDDIWYEGYRWFGPIPEDKK